MFAGLKQIINEHGKKWAPFILRMGLAFVFLYFGVSQLRNPDSFIGWLPKEVSLLPLTPRTFVLLNGAFELLFGSMMALGLYTRISAFLLGAHLIGIAFTIGWNEIGVRDLGLALSTIALSIWPTIPFSLDAKMSSGKGRSAAIEAQQENDENKYKQ